MDQSGRELPAIRTKNRKAKKVRHRTYVVGYYSPCHPEQSSNQSHEKKIIWATCCSVTSLINGVIRTHFILPLMVSFRDGSVPDVLVLSPPVDLCNLSKIPSSLWCGTHKYCTPSAAVLSLDFCIFQAFNWWPPWLCLRFPSMVSLLCIFS